MSIAATAELRWRNADGDQRASVIPYLRWDSVDDDRKLADLQEAYWAREGGSVELLAGVNTVFWGVTESVHLVDIVNQTDAAGDIDGEDKLGQPMVNLAWQQDWGMISAYLMPYFRERNYPGLDGRLRTPVPVDSDRAVYQSSRKQNHVDVALRYSHYIGDVDVGLSIFSGTSREPRLVPADDAPVLLPHYDQIDQFGVDLQYTRDAWLWKLEAIARNGYSETFAAAVGGFEFGLQLSYDDRKSFVGQRTGSTQFQVGGTTPWRSASTEAIASTAPAWFSKAACRSGGNTASAVAIRRPRVTMKRRSWGSSRSRRDSSSSKPQSAPLRSRRTRASSSRRCTPTTRPSSKSFVSASAIASRASIASGFSILAMMGTSVLPRSANACRTAPMFAT